MFNQLLILLEQPAPAPPVVTGKKISEGGGAEIRRIPRQQPLLEFELKQGFIVSGTIIDQKTSIQQLIRIPYPVHGQISERKTIPIRVRGIVQGHIQARFRPTGEITENITDLERDIADTKYLIQKKRRRREN